MLGYSANGSRAQENMKKKVLIQDLMLGMYIAELDRPWGETPFIFQGFELSSQEQLETVSRLCTYVYIDTELGHHSTDSASARQQQVRPAALEPVNKKRLEFELLRSHAHSVLHAEPYADKTVLEEEVERVRETYDAACDLINNSLDDARMGRIINMPEMRTIIGKMAASIVRNPDALMLFAQLRAKDEYSAQHAIRSSVLSLALGRQLGMDAESMQVLGIGALLHDIGKVRIPDEILTKPEELTAAEAEIIKQHVPFGLQILRTSAPDLPTMALEVVGWHHERFDGSGYMTGAKGSEVSQFGYIGGIVDYFDGITSERPWRAATAPHTALMHMYDRRGQAFHPKLVEQFIRCIGVYPIGAVVQLNSGETAVVVTRNRERYLKPRVMLATDVQGVPYHSGRILDLTSAKRSDGAPYEINKVLDVGEYSINPVEYFPLLAA